MYKTSEGYQLADEFDEVSLDYGRVFVHVQWRGLTKESHVAQLRVFDGAGKRSTTSDHEFTAKSEYWSNWWPYYVDPEMTLSGTCPRKFDRT